jgi:tetratricopeptide (TPR) repeat protein
MWVTMVDRDVGAKLRAELARLTPLNPFEVLGIPTNASAEQVRTAYLTATKAYHPNRYARENVETVEAANEVFLVIRRAYGLLWDDAKRKATQQKLAGAGPAPPRIRAGLESAPSPGAAPPPAARPPTMPVAPTAMRTPATQPPLSTRAEPPTQPPIGAAPSRMPPMQPPRSGQTPPPQLTVPAGSRAPATQPPRGPSASTAATPRPRPPVVPTQMTAALAGTKPVSPQTGRSPEQVTAVLEAVQTRGQRFELACRLIQKNRAQEARPLLNQLVSEDRHHRKYRVKLMHAVALEHRDAGRFDEAIRDLERAVAFDPEVPEIRAELEKLREQRKGFFSKLFGR